MYIFSKFDCLIHKISKNSLFHKEKLQKKGKRSDK